MSKRLFIALYLPCKLLVAISVLRAFVQITDMVEIAISAADPITDPIIGTSLVAAHPVYLCCAQE